MSILSKAFEDEYQASPVSQQAQNALEGLQKTYPDIARLLQGQLTPQAVAELNAAKAVTPGYNDLAVGELNRLAPQLTATQGALDAGQAQSDLANIGQYGQPLGVAMRSADAAANPEYYNNLGVAGNKLTEAFNSWSPNLTGGQRAEVERGTARLNPGGADNSAVSTAEKAMQFGTAHQNQIANFSNAINQLSNTVPALKTGLNPINLALGRDSRTSPALGMVTGAVKPSQVSTTIGASQATNLLGAAANNENIKAGKFKTWGDALNQDSETFKNIAGGAASIAGA